MNDDDPRHGTQNAYNHLGCRCHRCKKAHADYHRVRYVQIATARIGRLIANQQSYERRERARSSVGGPEEET